MSAGQSLPSDPNSKPLFEQYYSLYAKRIQEDALRIALGDQDLADDIAQAGFVALWKTSLKGEVSQYARLDALSHMLKARRVEHDAQVIERTARVHVRTKPRAPEKPDRILPVPRPALRNTSPGLQNSRIGQRIASPKQQNARQALRKAS